MTLVLRTIPAARHWAQTERTSGKTIGLVPTMGSIHEGHLSLVRRALQSCDRVAVTIFINPLQFGPEEDYERYPRSFERDRSLLEQEGVHAIFSPDVRVMYPSPPSTFVCAGKLGETLDGAARPGHFRGVATVVAKLFHILPPDRAFFGQKDAQQAVIVQRMVRDLNFPLEIEICPTVREPDGLAMSSRNVYLSAAERADANILYRSLKHAQNLIRSGVRDAATVIIEMQEMIRGVHSAELVYASIMDLLSLEGVREIDREVLVAVAVRFGSTRLIDNLIVAPVPSEPHPAGKRTKK